MSRFQESRENEKKKKNNWNRRTTSKKKQRKIQIEENLEKKRKYAKLQSL